MGSPVFYWRLKKPGANRRLFHVSTQGKPFWNSGVLSHGLFKESPWSNRKRQWTTVGCWSWKRWWACLSETSEEGNLKPPEFSSCAEEDANVYDALASISGGKQKDNGKKTPPHAQSQPKGTQTHHHVMRTQETMLDGVGSPILPVFSGWPILVPLSMLSIQRPHAVAKNKQKRTNPTGKGQKIL